MRSKASPTNSHFYLFAMETGSNSTKKSTRGRLKKVIDLAEDVTEVSELNEVVAAKEELDNVAGGNLMWSKASLPERKRIWKRKRSSVGLTATRRAQKSNGGIRSITNQDESGGVLQAKRHFTAAKVDGLVYKLGGDAYVKMALPGSSQ
ncbi:PREDICTED: uncharacterized protein LOC109158493 isoform X1 [Ipomoea nil]|uniref:uncharacterized protein LOC109158493 isoform X1 n=1 Tax=Ipomoea nil TaxID=35883 RepID=UPI0009019855|nr:PREDICTED: uncharacterized protein LOC109158493 isoform X1 [Ipomoea nil]